MKTTRSYEEDKPLNGLGPHDQGGGDSKPETPSEATSSGPVRIVPKVSHLGCGIMLPNTAK